MMKQVIILIGLKGSGKTHIGTLAKEKLGIDFFRVENVWLDLKSKRLSDEYMEEGFKLVETKIDNLLLDTNRIIIESTGTTIYFKFFLEKLKSKYEVKLVKINTSAEKCFQRVKSRDASVHIPVSDDLLEKVNKEAQQVKLKYDTVIDNEESSDTDIINRLKEIIN